MELLTAAQMRAIERAAIESGAVAGLELMERAGAGVVAAVFDWRPALAEGARSACVLCGPGNNGGDGFVVARLLSERGWSVSVFLLGEEARLPPDAAENARRWRAMGGAVAPLTPEAAAGAARSADLWIDALFGTGLARPIAGPCAELLRRLGADDSGGGERGVAIDIPSGLCADSGRWLGPEHRCGLAVSFHRPKLGHVLAAGPERIGRLAVADIGLEAAGGDDVATLTSPPADVRKRDGHKYAHGHALIVSGPATRTGAARLAARGALRIGAGLVTVASPPNALMENAAHLTAIMLRRMAGPEALADLLSDSRLNAVCLGPGLGVGAQTRALVAAALEAGRKSVLDADALTAFRDDPATLFGLLHEDCALTPHDGEFGRLFPDLREKLKAPALKGPAYSRVDAAREAAARAGCVVLLKGPDTVIADPQGRCSVNAARYEREAPWLATAGSGDVLAGMVAGLLARGFPAMRAAEAAAWLHVECGRARGPGLIAEDLPEALPEVLKRTLAQVPGPA